MDRRLLLSLIAGTVALPQIVRALPLPPPQPHRLNLLNAHTGEKSSGISRDVIIRIPRVMEELSIFLRDFQDDEKVVIEVALLDVLSGLLQNVGELEATIISAYRTP